MADFPTADLRRMCSEIGLCAQCYRARHCETPHSCETVLDTLVQRRHRRETGRISANVFGGLWDLRLFSYAANLCERRSRLLLP
jgi:hypothetical protein